MRYLAFISYRHRDRDQRVSGLLRRGLENHRLPAGCSLDRKRKVFRDTDELPTSADLGADIQNALRDSGFLIPLCSEGYMASKWCLKELGDWIASGRRDRILPILVSGTPETAMPESIRDIPSAGDLRGLEGRELKRKTAALVTGLLARMSGTGEEALAAAERRFRLARAAGIFACLAAAVFGFGLYTLRTADLIARNNDSIREATAAALKEKSTALEERNNALLKKAGYYTDLAWDAVNSDRPLEAARLALEALPEDPDGDEPVSLGAVSALRVALNLPGRTRDDYVLIRTVALEDTVTGFAPVEAGMGSTHEGADKLILTTDGDTLYELTLSTGEMTDFNAGLLAEAEAMGYSMARHITNNGMDTIFYGRENQMLNTRYGTVLYTLNGEPFCADRLIQSASGGYILAWLEDPLPGQERRAAVFRLPDLRRNVPADGAEALSEIPMTHGILTAVFPARGSSLAVLDLEGTLRLYDIDTGRLKRELEGNYVFAAPLKDVSSALFVTDAAGNGSLLDLITGDEVYRLGAPGRIREIWYCERKSCLLACCDDGIRLYDALDGKLLKEAPMPEAPLSAVWGGYDPYMFLHEGNQIALLFDSEIDVSALKKDSDPLLSGTRTLHIEGTEARTRAAFFSPDGSALYLQSADGGLSKWDVATGELSWTKAAAWTRAPSQMPSSRFSADGSAIWRANRDGNGYERIDPATGDTLYVNQVVSSTTLGTLLESPDGAVALHVKSGGGACVFDVRTGGILWRVEDLGDCCFFSEDGREIVFVRHRQDRKADREWTELIRVDTLTGERLEERVLRDGKYAYVNTAFDGDARKLVLLDDEKRSAWVITLPDGGITEYPLPDIVFEDQLTSLAAVSYEGRAAVRWSNKERREFLIELREDGTVGPVAAADTPEGRRLGTGSSFRYMGEEARWVTEKLPEGRVRRIERISDGECLLEIRQGEEFGLTLSPDEKYLCVYYDARPAVLIPMTDAGTLIAMAREVTGGMSDE